MEPTPQTILHHARCSCGQLRLRVHGDPTRVSVCHCKDCQRRTGSAFGAQVRFSALGMGVVGESRRYDRSAESGHVLSFYFCPQCGASVYYTNSNLPDFVGVPLGALEAPGFAEPQFSVYERSRLPWVGLPAHWEHAQD